MPEEKQTEKQNDSQQAKSVAKGGGILKWLIPVVFVAICTGAGFSLGRLLGTSGTPGAKTPPAQKEPPPETKTVAAAQDKDKLWYYPLEPVVANLNEPGVTRYVRATLTLALSYQADQKKTTEFFEEKKPMLTNLLTIYLASLSIADIRGERNLNRIRMQVLDMLNEKLFPNAKPQIKDVLFKEFAVQ